MHQYIFAVYDEVTGEISGRIRTSSRAVAESYPNKIELTLEEFTAKPELTHLVDVMHLKTTGQKRLKRRIRSEL